MMAFDLEVQGEYSPEQAARRGVPKWTKPRRVIALDETAALAAAYLAEPEATFVVVKGSRPLKWGEMPLEAIEVWTVGVDYKPSTVAASLANWKRRGFTARQFRRSVRAGGASADVVVVVVRRKS